MANCEVTSYRPPPPPPVNTYTLKLSQEEVEVLALILARVAGDPYVSRRCHVRAICDSLREVGVYFSELPADDVSGNIRFEDQG